MTTVCATDTLGSLSVSEAAPGLLDVVVRGRLSAEVGAAFPRYARAAAERAARCAVFLDVRGLDAFDGAVRSAWLQTVLEHRGRIDEVVVLSQRLVVTLSARAAALALAPFGVRFDVVTDERHYEARRAKWLAPYLRASSPAPCRAAST